MKTSLVLLTVLLPTLSWASLRSFKATAEKAEVLLEQLKSKENQYFIQLENLDASFSGRPIIVERTLLKNGTEEFRAEGSGLYLRLGPDVANLYTKPPVAGVLTFKKRDILLTPSERTVDLKGAYDTAECLSEESKEKATAELNIALSELNKQCGSTLKLDVDWKSFKAPGLACNGREFLKGMSTLCADADYKSAIKGYEAVRVQSASTPTIKKDKKVLTYTAAPGAVNTSLTAAKWLEENL